VVALAVVSVAAALEAAALQVDGSKNNIPK
jgi:hypothetical protein